MHFPAMAILTALFAATAFALLAGNEAEEILPIRWTGQLHHPERQN
jgi:hypothetical protein